MGLSRSSYCDWIGRPESDKAKKDKEMSAMVGEILK